MCDRFTPALLESGIIACRHPNFVFNNIHSRPDANHASNETVDRKSWLILLVETPVCCLVAPHHQARQGRAECALATIMGAHGQTITEALHSPHLPHQRASITVRAEQAKNSSDLVVFELGAANCPRGHKRFVRV